ncbi:hypothetical protein Q5P01_002374 [Channa striata]|uniref:Ig-like domain-containing protein n=1 Tax=Channa striata TaxID=64152 RepID=A0AA88NSM3_CHASR|nr:hypothetical protein Q5P01_002374 [Channa striata]
MEDVKLLTLASIVLCVSSLCCGQCVILGDAFTFPEIGDCRTDGDRVVRQVGQGNTHLVAVRQDNLWTPHGQYGDRVHPSSSLRLERTVYTDTGVYEFICAGSGRFLIIQLSVVVAHDTAVREGDAVRLKCYHDTTRVEAVRWLRHGELVFERNVSSGKSSYAEGREGRGSLSAGGFKEGNLQLTWERAEPDDQGDYLCYIYTVGDKTGSCVSAERLKVSERQSPPVPYTPAQPACRQNVTEGTSMGPLASVLITAAVTVPVFTLFGWFLKSRCPDTSREPAAGSCLDVVRRHLTTNPPPRPQANGSPTSHSPGAGSII